MNSNAKGKRTERELRAHWRRVYPDIQRSASQYRSGTDGADLEPCPDFWIESKARQKGNVRRWLEDEQAKEHRYCDKNATDHRPVVVCHKRKRKPWLVTMDLGEFLTLVEYAKRGGL